MSWTAIVTLYLMASCVTIMYSYSVMNEEDKEAYLTSYLILGLLWPLLLVGGLIYRIHYYCSSKNDSQSEK
jgi:heme/copper-type cytochrome/quinol oxidase subunit 3